MQLDPHEPPLDPIEPRPHPGPRARGLLLFLLGLSLLGLGLSLYLRGHARVPPVTTRPIVIPAPVSVLAASQRSPYAVPGPDWRARVEQELVRLRALHGPLPAPQPGDWVLSHPEPGQTFAEYLDGEPSRPTASRSTLYVQPIGLFSAEQREIVRLAAEYLGLYFRLPVQILPDLPTQVISVSAVRRHPRTHELQLHTGTVLSDVLAPRLPADAAAYIALTAIDLFPHPRWNFVFGQASLSGTARLGIWSLARFGNPAQSDPHFRLALRRTLKTATHETGHLFGMRHCKAHPCSMNGANSLEEADRWPLHPCPECLAKLLWLTGTTSAEWLRGVLAFYEKHGLTAEAERTRHQLGTL